MNDHKFTGRPSSERMTLGERWARFKRRAPLYRRALREWGRIHGRRITHQFHNVVAGNRAAGPVTFLACSGALAVALTMTTLYTPAYSVTLDGESVGVGGGRGGGPAGHGDGGGHRHLPAGTRLSD